MSKVSLMDQHGLMLARVEAAQSKDPSTKVGAIVSNNTVIKAHNGFLGAGFDPANASREERYARVVHAELRALMSAGALARGSTVYSSEEPCLECAKALITAGVKRLVHYKTSADRRERWNCDLGRQLLEEAGIEILEVDREQP